MTFAVPKLRREHVLRFIFCFMTMLIALGNYGPGAGALSPDQKKVLQEGLYYYNTEVCGNSATSSTVSAGSGAPDGGSFPNLDPAAMASAIDAFVKKQSPRSPLNGLGTTIVASAQKANVNPFLVPAIAIQETSLGTVSTPQVTQAHDLFNRRATTSQPHISIGTGLWYKWSSVKTSVDYSAPENQHVAGGGDFLAYLRNQYGSAIDGSDYSRLFSLYDPGYAAYAGNVRDWMSEMINNAQSNSGGSVPSSSSSSCCPAGGGTTDSSLVGNNNVEKAYNYFVGKGLTPQQAAGIVGNLMLESGVDPHKSEGGSESSTPTSGGWGIAQWTPGTGIVSIAGAAHVTGPIDQLATQLDILWGELSGKAGSYDESQVLNDIKSTNTVEDAVVAFQGNANVGGKYLGFERPADESATVAQRTTYAKQVLAKYGGGAAGSSSCSGTGTDTTGYKNPLRDVKNLGPARIDMGVDYTGSGPVYAMGNGTIANLTNSGWPGGTFISYKLADGPAQGKYVYFAENCKDIKVHVSQKVNSDTVLCSMVDAYPHVETGWAQPPGAGDTIAIHNGGYTEGYATAAGENYNQLLVKLGAPSGTQQPKMGSLPPGWPTW